MNKRILDSDKKRVYFYIHIELTFKRFAASVAQNNPSRNSVMHSQHSISSEKQEVKIQVYLLTIETNRDLLIIFCDDERKDNQIVALFRRKARTDDDRSTEEIRDDRRNLIQLGTNYSWVTFSMINLETRAKA